MANWLERAKLEIPQTARRGTVISAERTLTAVLAVPPADVSEISSAANASNGTNDSTPSSRLADFDPATASAGWRLHFSNREPMQVFFAPPTTHSEAMAIYPDAVAAEPIAMAANDGDPVPAFLEMSDDEILAGAVELDALICELCDLAGFSADARARMLAVRRRMAAANLPAEIFYFRQAVRKAQASAGGIE